MRHSTYITLTFCTISLSVIGQNLLRDGGFEKYYSCPDNYTVEYTKRFLPHWNMPTKGTPDYFNRCSKEMVGVPQNFMGSILPAEGDGFVGLVLLDTPDLKDEIDYRDYVHSGPLAPVTITNAKIRKPDTKRRAKPINYREYIQTHLITPLQPDQLYRISFKYALAQHSTFVSNRLGVVFTQNQLKQKDGALPYNPNVFIDTLVAYSQPGIWVEFADTFRTKGGELYMTIGNFYPDSLTGYFNNDISSVNLSLQRAIITNQVSYYYIDDVKLEPVSKESVSKLSQRFIPFSLLKRTEYKDIDTLNRYFALLDEVYFNIGQPNPKPHSFCEIDRLIAFLSDNVDIGIELYGLLHEVEIDPVGADNRVDALRKQLIHSGIAESRIKLKVFDDLKSISNKYSFYCEGRRCVYYSSLIAIRFFKI